ncbi:MAG: group I intron-associated PD-(D/E)XK endonuclease [Petrotogales bacterium]
MNASLSKETLGLAGEYAVASELCKRGIYAQLTLGNRKRTDLLVETDDSMLRIQVKSKQKKEWPGIKGITGNDIVLVLVDFEKKPLNSRPDFYVLTSSDWAQIINARCVQPGHLEKGKVTISDSNVPTWSDGYVGMGIKSVDVQAYKEKWEKIELCLTR